MGQRLVVTIKENDKPKMKIYYHWSAYTASTFDVLNDLWNNAIKPLKRAGKSTDEILLGIIKYLEGHVDEKYKAFLDKNFPDQKRSCHGGIGFFNKKRDPFAENLPNEELEYIQSLYPNETFSTDVDRNEGLVYMSTEGMDDVQGWSEGDATIWIDDETYSHEINWVYNGKDEFIENQLDDRYGDDIDKSTEEYKELEQEFNSLNVYDGDGIDLFEGKCDNIAKNWAEWDRLTGSDYRFRDKNNTVWEGLA